MSTETINENRNVFFKNISIFSSLFLIMVYCVGFVFDAAYLEQFGIKYYQMVGSPLDYLSIGGMYILNFVAVNYIEIVIIFGLFGCAYYKLEELSEIFFEKVMKKKNFIRVLIGCLPFSLLLLFPIYNSAVASAKDDMSIVGEDKICVDENEKCLKGNVLRYRDSKIIFYSSENKETYVFTDRKLKQGMHKIIIKRS